MNSISDLIKFNYFLRGEKNLLLDLGAKNESFLDFVFAETWRMLMQVIEKKNVDLEFFFTICQVLGLPKVPKYFVNRRTRGEVFD